MPRLCDTSTATGLRVRGFRLPVAHWAWGNQRDHDSTASGARESEAARARCRAHWRPPSHWQWRKAVGASGPGRWGLQIMGPVWASAWIPAESCTAACDAGGNAGPSGAWHHWHAPAAARANLKGRGRRAGSLSAAGWRTPGLLDSRLGPRPGGRPSRGAAGRAHWHGPLKPPRPRWPGMDMRRPLARWPPQCRMSLPVHTPPHWPGQ